MISHLKEMEKSAQSKKKNGNTLTEEDVIISRWTEYCTELYNHPVTGDTAVLNIINENEEP